MRYEGKLYRPPSEADAYILQATVGCSWNRCVYCDMYREKSFRVRELAESLADVEAAGRRFGAQVDKVFVADGDALVMPVGHWEAILGACRAAFPALRRVSCYAMARNVLEKTDEELARLRAAGLSLLYIGPESGDDVTLRRIAKGQDRADHVAAARKAKGAGMALSVIFLLGAGGVERSDEHARESARLASEMDPEFLSALTLTVVPGTPLATLAGRGRFELPAVPSLLRELRAFVSEAAPSDALFRTNHASNHLPLGGRLPRDRARIVATLDAALEGRIALREEGDRGL
ncbi:MAG: Oxygen-independent coproporphyrinogen oxidase, Fe-S oxidoreductase [Myxococcaceae bacterium]|nr:Oxygen-independent coproporphyrinogen oxidase, Fe-S oxidoreductase [Myxococcaceae bacterium]